MTDPAIDRSISTFQPTAVFCDSVSEVDGIIEAIGTLDGKNKIVAAFYDGPGWTRFKPWETMFLLLQGGSRRARQQILNWLPDLDRARVLEVGIGDGANLPLLPSGWDIHGIDIARSRLVDCLQQHAFMGHRLAWAQAESLPYDNAVFDATYSIGGFNYFGDPEKALREMRRVTKPGGTIIVADEVPWLPRCGIGNLLGVPKIDEYWMRALGLDRDFAAFVVRQRLDVGQLFRRVCPESRLHAIWHGLGYCMVDLVQNETDPEGVSR
jgi:SAM-dependent methyltransferase